MEMHDYYNLVDHYGREEYFRRIGERISDEEKQLIRSFSAVSEAGDPMGRRLMELYCPSVKPERLYFAASIGDSWAALQLGSFHSHGHQVYHYEPVLSEMYLNRALAGNSPEVREEALRELSVRSFRREDYKLEWETLVDYLGTDEVVVIPPRVRVIDSDAFRGNTHVRKVIFHSRVRCILDSAFQDCVNLETVILPRGLQVIGKRAFSGCTRLREIRLPESLYLLDYGAFRDCRSLRSVRVPGGVHMLDSVFWNSGLEEVYLENGVRELKGFPFEDCPIRIFRHCSTLEKIGVFAIPADVKSRIQVFEPGERERNRQEPSPLMKQALEDLFRHAPKEEPELLEALYDEYPALMEFGAHLAHPRSLLMLAWALGAGRMGFPADPERAAELCRRAAEGSQGNWQVLARKQEYMFSLVGKYPDKLGIREGSNLYIRPGVTEIPGNAFCGDTTVETLWLPHTLRRIGKEAFRGCTGLRRIHWHTGLLQIGDGAFRDCGALTDLKFPDGLTHIGERAFAACASLQDISVPGSVIRISRGAFERAGVTTVHLDPGVRVVEKDAFRDCPLTGFRYHLSLETVEANAFRGCKELRCFIQYGSHKRLRMYWTDYRGRHNPLRDNAPVLYCQDDYDRNLRTQDGQEFEVSMLLNLDGLPSRRDDSGYYVYIPPTDGPILI